MSHRPDSVAPDLHPVCCSCAALPLIGMPCPPTGGRVAVRAGRAAVRSVPDVLDRYQGADLEGCCWCGLVTDQGYYAWVPPPAGCSTEMRNVVIYPVPWWKRAWRTVVRRFG